MTDQLDLSCDDAVLVFWDLLRDEADPPLASRVRSHLSICPRCRARLAFEREFLESMNRGADEETDTTSLRSRVLKTLAERGVSKSPEQ